MIEKLQEKVIAAAANPDFRHHEWFVTWHLRIVEKIALELCDLYPEADREVVHALVWVHDYPRIIDYDHVHEQEVIEKVRPLLLDSKFPIEFVDKVMEYLFLMESKLTIDLTTAPIEVKIISSADGAAHFFGPFYRVYWKDNAQKTYDQLLEDNKYKLWQDWERKIVLPEVKKSFQVRFGIMEEIHGKLPEKFFS